MYLIKESFVSILNSLKNIFLSLFLFISTISGVKASIMPGSTLVKDIFE